MSTYEDPYTVDFGIFSTLDQAMACAYANRSDDIPVFVVRKRLNGMRESLLIDIVAWPDVPPNRWDKDEEDDEH